MELALYIALAIGGVGLLVCVITLVVCQHGMCQALKALKELDEMQGPAWDKFIKECLRNRERDGNYFEMLADDRHFVYAYEDVKYAQEHGIIELDEFYTIEALLAEKYPMYRKAKDIIRFHETYKLNKNYMEGKVKQNGKTV